MKSFRTIWLSVVVSIPMIGITLWITDDGFAGKADNGEGVEEEHAARLSPIACFSYRFNDDGLPDFTPDGRYGMDTVLIGIPFNRYATPGRSSRTIPHTGEKPVGSAPFKRRGGGPPSRIDRDVYFREDRNLKALNLCLQNNFEEEDAITVVASVRNTGEEAVNDILVQFYLGHPDHGGEKIGNDITIPTVLPDSTVDESVLWSGFTGSSPLYFFVDPDNRIAERNEADNADSLSVAMRDSVPWVWQEIDGYCHYASMTMLFNLHDAGNTVYETVELACCPHSFLSADDQFWFLGGILSLSQTMSDIEFAGEIRNFRTDIQIENSWESYLAELTHRIEEGIPAETSIDPYYLPQEDYDLLRQYDLHSGHGIVIVGCSDSSVVVNDPGVGLSFFGQPPIPEPEKRGSNVIMDLQTFRNGIEATMGTPYVLISFTPEGAIPSHDEMLRSALETSTSRIEGESSAFDPLWSRFFPSRWDLFYGLPALSIFRDDLDLNTFTAVYDSLMGEYSNDYLFVLNLLASQLSGLFESYLGWYASGVYYATRSESEASNLYDLMNQLTATGESLQTTFTDMLNAIYYADGDPEVAEPYLALFASDFSQLIPKEEAVSHNLRALYERLSEGVFYADGRNGSPHSSLSFALHQNTPNPFNPETRILYTVADADHVSLKIFNSRGQHVKTLVEGQHTGGHYSVVWDGTDERGREVSSGVYFYGMSAGGSREMKRMVLVK
jgi:hypothetical protein